jgi:outer membrane immunogenic protein
MKIPFAISLLAFVAFLPTANAQSAPSYKLEVGAGYNFLHTNAPPTQCGCFDMNGGTVSLAYHLKPAFSLVGEFQVLNNGNVSATGHDLKLFTYLVGPRYSFVTSRSRLHPFGEVLVGGSHASGSLYSTSAATSGKVNGFAASIGGGLDVALTPHITFRAVQIDYLLTKLPNGANSRQNNLSLSTGVVLRFGSR